MIAPRVFDSIEYSILYRVFYTLGAFYYLGSECDHLPEVDNDYEAYEAK